MLVLVLAVWTGGSLQPWEEEFLLGQDALERSDYSAAELHLATSLELIEQFEPLPADGREMKAWVESSLADSIRLQGRFEEAGRLYRTHLSLEGMSPDFYLMTRAAVALGLLQAGDGLDPVWWTSSERGIRCRP